MLLELLVLVLNYLQHFLGSGKLLQRGSNRNDKGISRVLEVVNYHVEKDFRVLVLFAQFVHLATHLELFFYQTFG